LIQTDIPNPKIYIDGTAATSEQAQKNDQGFYEIKLSKGASVVFTPNDLKNTKLKIEPIPVNEANRNLFGLNKKTQRLPGHKFYDKK